jgi:hypothetical protein
MIGLRFTPSFRRLRIAPGVQANLTADTVLRVAVSVRAGEPVPSYITVHATISPTLMTGTVRASDLKTL